MIEIINLDKLSNDGFKQPANDPTSNTPDNITHAQLRYNTFSSSYVIQGVVVTGSSSTFEFTVPAFLKYSLFKLYVSTDGTTYTEKKSYGGSTGRTLLAMTFGSSMKLIVNQMLTSAPTVKTFFNNTIYAVTTKTREAVGDYVINFDGNIFEDQSKVSIEYKSLLIDGGALTAAVEIPSTGLGLSSMNIQTSIILDPNNISLTPDDSVLTQYVITINIEP